MVCICVEVSKFKSNKSENFFMFKIYSAFAIICFCYIYKLSKTWHVLKSMILVWSVAETSSGNLMRKKVQEEPEEGTLGSRLSVNSKFTPTMSLYKTKVIGDIASFATRF